MSEGETASCDADDELSDMKDNSGSSSSCDEFWDSMKIVGITKNLFTDRELGLLEEEFVKLDDNESSFQMFYQLFESFLFAKYPEMSHADASFLFDKYLDFTSLAF